MHRPGFATAMQQRLSLVTMACDDVGGERAFYERLGWKCGFGTEDVAFFQMPGLVFGLYGRASLAADLGRPPSALGLGRVMVSYNVEGQDDVAAVLDTAQAAGASVVTPSEDTPWGGRSGTFATPEGHLWEVAWNPAWRNVEGITRMD